MKKKKNTIIVISYTKYKLFFICNFDFALSPYPGKVLPFGVASPENV